MKLYHVTSSNAAAKIVKGGFLDGRLTGFLIDGEAMAAVSLLDRPGNENEGARHSVACIEVDVPDDVAHAHEHLAEILPSDPDPLPFEPPPAGANAFVAEWSIPAAVLNRFPRRILKESEWEKLGEVTRRTLYRHL